MPSEFDNVFGGEFIDSMEPPKWAASKD